jgi:hypothetical protein
MNPTAIPIRLLVEDLLSEQVLRRVLKEFPHYDIIGIDGYQGNSYLKNIAPKYNQAARFFPYLLLTDLDAIECPLALLDDWLPTGRQPYFVFRIAVREVEAWLLADRVNLAEFLKVPVAKLPLQPDLIPDPKQTLINVARGSNSKAIRDDLVPSPRSTSKVGKNYNGHLALFVAERWDILAACQESGSLARAYKRLRDFRWQQP